MFHISVGLGIALMLNNYVHDVATGLLLISALWIGWSASDLGSFPTPETLELFRASYRRCIRFVIGSICIIIVTGVIRTIFFMSFEWQPALGKGLIPVLILKHVLIFSMLIVGVYSWSRLRGRLALLPGWEKTQAAKERAEPRPLPSGKDEK